MKRQRNSKAMLAGALLGSLSFGLMSPHSHADSARYYRVWQGFRRNDFSQDKFMTQLPSFMKETVNLYKGKGLNNYMVVIPPKTKADFLPDEFALVALESEEAYRDVRNTEAGKQYSARHWDVFDKERSFSSQHFVVEPHDRPQIFQNNWTYDMIGKSVDWSSGYSAVFVGTRQNGISAYEFLNRLREHTILTRDLLQPLGMQGYIVLANENYEVAYINWKSRDAHDRAFELQAGKTVFDDAQTLLSPVMYKELRPFAAGSRVIEDSAYSTTYHNQVVNKKALLVVTSHDRMGKTGQATGYYLSEVSHPFFALQENGIHVEIASPLGGNSPMDENSRDLSDPVNARLLSQNENLLRETLPISKALEIDFDGILLAGGHGTMWDFPRNKLLGSMILEIFESGGIVAAVCHGPAALLGIQLSSGANLLNGRKVTGFTNDEERAVQLEKLMPFSLQDELKKSGGNFFGRGLWQANVVVDENLITGQNPASAQGVGEAMAEALLKSAAEE